jgi:hypothetical protein
MAIKKVIKEINIKEEVKREVINDRMIITYSDGSTESRSM